jgi:hypothetical protein
MEYEDVLTNQPVVIDNVYVYSLMPFFTTSYFALTINFRVLESLKPGLLVMTVRNVFSPHSKYSFSFHHFINKVNRYLIMIFFWMKKIVSDDLNTCALWPVRLKVTSLLEKKLKNYEVFSK